jgi:hypothetical protein
MFRTAHTLARAESDITILVAGHNGFLLVLRSYKYSEALLAAAVKYQPLMTRQKMLILNGSRYL